MCLQCGTTNRLGANWLSREKWVGLAIYKAQCDNNCRYRSRVSGISVFLGNRWLCLAYVYASESQIPSTWCRDDCIRGYFGYGVSTKACNDARAVLYWESRYHACFYVRWVCFYEYSETVSMASSLGYKHICGCWAGRYGQFSWFRSSLASTAQRLGCLTQR